MTGRSKKPDFIMSKGERNAMDSKVDVSRLMEHYRQVAGGLYKWEGLPEGCPLDFIESLALWTSSGVGCKEAKGMGPVIAPIKPSTLTIYGTPYDWIPVSVRGMLPIAADADFFKPTNDPSLWMGSSIEETIRPFVHLMARAMKVLDVNLFSLSQPVMISGLPSAPLAGLVLASEVMDGELYIPTTTRNGVDAQVLDLKAEDHTQNLVSTIDWCDARILEIMASSNGVEKASGINTLETVSGVQSVIQQIEIGLDKRLEWTERVNEAFGMNMTVRPGKGIEAILRGNDEPREPSQEGMDGPARLSLRLVLMPEGRGRRGTYLEDGGNT